MVEEQPTGRGRRRRRVAQPWQVLPQLAPDQHRLLCDWAQGGAESRRWDSLYSLAGRARLELADQLLPSLLQAGVIELDERFNAGLWWPRHLYWVDLPRLQQQLGLVSADQRSRQREQLDVRLAQLATEQPLLAETVSTLRAARLTPALRQSRTALLEALVHWRAEQRQGVRQDFALFARQHTKAISEAEWTWLRQQLDLAEWGIQPFVPLLWLAGQARLDWAAGPLALAALPLVGLPAESLAGLQSLTPPPDHYWLIENRASFERQALQCPAGCLLLWMPGRPSLAWQQAVAWLLQKAPAPARISADADPAGIEITLTAAALWESVGQAWSPCRMGVAELSRAKTQPLNGYDRGVLERLLKRAPPLSTELHELAQAMQQTGRKAEQEAWL